MEGTRQTGGNPGQTGAGSRTNRTKKGQAPGKKGPGYLGIKIKLETDEKYEDSSCGR